MEAIEKVSEFLKEAKVFYLSTLENGKPKNRPLGFQLLTDDKLYFGVGTFKDVYKQMQENPYVEIAAHHEKRWIRYYGKAVFEKTEEMAEKALDAAPHLRAIYNEITGRKLGVFHLEEATAEFRSMMAVEESYKF